MERLKTCQVMEVIRKRCMGTVEPCYDGLESGLDALAFIQGAIKKYGNIKECAKELQEYIIQEAEYILEDSPNLN